MLCFRSCMCDQWTNMSCKSSMTNMFSQHVYVTELHLCLGSTSGSHLSCVLSVSRFFSGIVLKIPSNESKTHNVNEPLPEPNFCVCMINIHGETNQVKTKTKRTDFYFSWVRFRSHFPKKSEHFQWNFRTGSQNCQHRHRRLTHVTINVFIYVLY